MARTAAQERLGFYPLWTQIVEQIGQYLVWPETGKTILFDPCAGEGEALDILRQMGGGSARTIVYAIEFAENRGAGCARRFTAPDDQVIQGVSATMVNFPRSKGKPRLNAHLMLFNPPYDHDPDYSRVSFRLMHFLMDAQKALAPGGLFISVLPDYDTLAHLKQYLGLFEQCSCFKLPEPYFSKWQQVVFMGVMRPYKLGHVSADTLLAWEQYLTQLPTLGEPIPDDMPIPEGGVPHPHYRLLSLPFGQAPGRMRNQVFDVLGVVDAVNTQGLLHSRQFVEQIFAPAAPPIEVIRPMSDGHLALAAAAGMFNGMVLDMRPEGGSVLGIRGTSSKVVKTTDHYETDQGVEITTQMEQVQTSVFALDLVTGEVTIYDLGTETPQEEDMPEFNAREVI